jgi:hypothetical protein
MTRTAGFTIVLSPCCGGRHAERSYASINFTAREYWTDGWSDARPPAHDSGLRRCQCGRISARRRWTTFGRCDDTELPRAGEVEPGLLPQCIAGAEDAEVEFLARYAWWHQLNHDYRGRYRLHREAEDTLRRPAAVTQVSWWRRLWGRHPAPREAPAAHPFTVPPFEPSDAQRQNMERLAQLIVAMPEAERVAHADDLAELWRELGQLDQAREVISRLDSKDMSARERLIVSLIDEGSTAPIRFRSG